MPTYDYICDACGHEFEAFESIKADPQTVCPTCHEARLRRKIGPGAAILFKGSGFYQTDYRSESYKKGADAEKSSSAPAKTSESKSSDGAGSSNGASPPPRVGTRLRPLRGHRSDDAERSEEIVPTRSVRTRTGGRRLRSGQAPVGLLHEVDDRQAVGAGGLGSVEVGVDELPRNVRQGL